MTTASPTISSADEPQHPLFVSADFGWREDAVALMWAIDILITTSLWEATTMVLLAAQRRIVMTDVGEGQMVVEQGRCAALNPAADAAADAVIDLIRDPERARLLADMAHAQHRERLNIPSMLRRYYKSVYASLATGRQAILLEAS